MLANKLSSPIMPAIAIREVVEEAYAADPEMIASAACDIQAVRTRDPAVDKYSTPLLYLKGFMLCRRIASVTGCGIRAVARWLFSAKPGLCNVPGRYSPGSKKLFAVYARRPRDRHRRW